MVVVEHSSGPSGAARYNPNRAAGIQDISKVEYEGYESDDGVSDSGGQEVVTAVGALWIIEDTY